MEENVMKDILSIGLQRKKKGKSSEKKTNPPEVPQTLQILTVPRKQIHRIWPFVLAG